MLVSELTKYIPTVIGILGVGGGGWWFKRWVDRVDRRLEQLTAAVIAMDKSHALSKQEMQQIQGQFKQTQICMDNATSKMGKLSGNLDALWRVLKSNKDLLVPSRLSDRDG